MIFFLVMPGLFGGFGNYFVPIFQGSPEVVYPRVNNFSILILLLSYLFLILSLISEFGGGTGWTLYPPLSTSFMTLSPSSTGNLIFGLIISGISSCLTSLNFWTTIHFLSTWFSKPNFKGAQKKGRIQPGNFCVCAPENCPLQGGAESWTYWATI